MLVGKVEILGNVDRRGAIRFDVGAASTLRAGDGRPLEVIVEDFSRTGFRFLADLSLPVDTLVSLGLSGAGARLACIVWRDGRAHGCMFLEPLTQEEITRAFRGQDEIVADLAASLEQRAVDRTGRPAPEEDGGKPNGEIGGGRLRRLFRRPEDDENR
ncbi:PilZ domain-containing protein [Stakelama tenebrarum]|uniref:PilZ domain-containing protein n=1 Tax=Stakelama tenebrarum TaxID=2711215 RepID=A0A6G6Y2Y5_9SPHN|nr:PilZ domain-containing protein [Sphingosinithalassobacter tenebrarum]QIG79260.1 hypothetical protein G5C33_05265 [Sphingosinithalassobacter tenebrarum]